MRKPVLLMGARRHGHDAEGGARQLPFAGAEHFHG